MRQYTDLLTFAAGLTIPGARGPARFGAVWAPFQRQELQALAPSLAAVAQGTKPPVGRFWWERTKGASKDTDVAVALLWLLDASRRTLMCQAAAVDADQADELRKILKDILRLNPHLTEAIEIQATRILNRHTESVAEIVPGDVPGSHGARPDVLLLNELGHIQKQEFAENLADNAQKVPFGVVIVATNAGFKPGWQWDWRENARSSPRWHFHKYELPAPWIDAEGIAEAEKRSSRSRFNRLWRGVWSSGAGDALDEDWITRAVVHQGPMEGRQTGWRFLAGLDLGLSHDFAALAVLAKHVGGVKVKEPEESTEIVSDRLRVLRDLYPLDYPTPESEISYERTAPTNKLRLAAVRVWRPEGGQIDLADVEEAVWRLHQKFGLLGVYYDTWQGQYLGQRLRKRGLTAVPVDPVGKNLDTMAKELMAAFREEQIELYDDPRLLADLRAASIVEKSYGYRVQFPRSKEAGHGDTGTAFLLALLGAARLKRHVPPRVNREICVA